MVEFGILALPFFTIIAAILETAVVFFAGQVLDSAVQDATRLIRTGQAQDWVAVEPQTTADLFREAVCANLLGMFDCDALKVVVTTVTNFDEAVVSYPLPTGEDCTEDDCDWTIPDAYAPGGGSQVVLVQAYYKWPTVVRLPGFNFQQLPDGTRLLGAVRVFKNEPFQCGDCT